MKRSTLVQGISIFGSIIFLLPVSRADDWYRWRGPDQNGISKESGWVSKWPDEGPRKLWKTSVGTGFSCMSISQGRLYTMGHDGNKTETIYCLDVTTGKPIWTKTYSAALDPNMYEGGPNATPTVDGDRVYTLSKKGDIFCLDAAKGTVLWSKNAHADLSNEIPMWGFSSSAVIEGDLVIFDIGSAGVALNKNTGDVVWLSGTSAPGYSTPVLSEFKGEKVVVISAADAVEAVKVADGKTAWSFPWKTQYDLNIADAVLSGGKMFVSSGYGHGCAMVDVSGATPKKIWENKDLRSHIASPVLWKGYVYGVDDLSSGSSALKCLSLETGEVKWTERRLGKGTLTIADGKIIALTDKGELMIIDPSPDSCKIISSAQVLGGKCWTAPVLSNGRIYCRNAKGDLVCLDVSAKPAGS